MAAILRLDALRLDALGGARVGALFGRGARRGAPGAMSRRGGRWGVLGLALGLTWATLAFPLVSLLVGAVGTVGAQPVSRPPAGGLPGVVPPLAPAVDSVAGRTPPDTAYPGIPEVPSDTGHLRPAWHDFSRFHWVGPLGMCAWTTLLAYNRVWWHGERDTASMETITSDTVVPAVFRIAERCAGDRLPGEVQKVVRGEQGFTTFWPAYVMAVALKQFDVSTTLVQGMLAQLKTAPARARFFEQVVAMDQDLHRPLRLALLARDTVLADAFFQRDTAFAGAVTMTWRWFVEYWRDMGDTGQARSAAEAYLTEYGRLPESRRPQSLEVAGEVLRQLTLVQHGAHSQELADLFARFARLEHQSSGNDQALPQFLFRHIDHVFVWPQTPYWYSAAGVRLPLATPVPPAGDVPGGAPPVPLPLSKVTLVWNPGSDEDHRVLVGHGTQVARTTTLLRELLAKDGPRGLQVVVVAQTRGMAPEVGAVGIAQEAPAIRQFYQERLGLHAAVVVDTVPFRVLPDGRRQDATTAWQRRYALFPALAAAEWVDVGGESPPAQVLVLDRQGKIRFTTPPLTFTRRLDPFLNLVLEQLLTEP